MSEHSDSGPSHPESQTEPITPPDQPSKGEDDDLPSAERASVKKTVLETKLLGEQLSVPYRAREWLKALTGLAAIAALLAALFQLQQNYYQRAEDRLERATARLASPDTSVRLAGVSTLRIVLDEAPSSQRRIALSALANSLGAESEPVVAGAILDLLKKTDSQSQDDVLEELANVSRGLLPAAMKKEPRQAYEPFVVDHGEFGRLYNVERAIVGFLHRGARTSDLSSIYCVQCNFDGLDLRSVDFSGAILGNSSFQGSILESSSFEHAVLQATNFTGADLRHVKFTLDPQNTAFAGDAIVNGGETAWGPDFTCANLEDADFSRQAFLSFVEQGQAFIDPGTYFTAKFSKADLARADFRSIGVYGAMVPRFKPQSSPGAMLTLMRLDFPFPMDVFAVDDLTRETDVLLPNGVKKVRYISFRGYVNPAMPLGNNLKMFATSLNRVAGAFANSNWNDAQLPNSLRQFLNQAQVPVSRSNPCTR